MTERVKLLIMIMDDIKESNIPKITKMWLVECISENIKSLLKQERTEETK